MQLHFCIQGKKAICLWEAFESSKSMHENGFHEHVEDFQVSHMIIASDYSFGRVATHCSVNITENDKQTLSL